MDVSGCHLSVEQVVSWCRALKDRGRRGPELELVVAGMCQEAKCKLLKILRDSRTVQCRYNEDKDIISVSKEENTQLINR